MSVYIKCQTDVRVYVKKNIKQNVRMYGMVWYVMVWYGMVSYGIVWYRVVWQFE